ncbi:MAG TPA: multiheme c-type cytochrome [Gemmatimonadaceae bacterium]|nr:multiheme c-type cytochrome [Gemmatimonadaceae bacterium]
MRTRVLLLLAILAACDASPPAGERDSFVGAARCAECHAPEYAAWRGSQHAVAMQEARPGAMLGRFDGTRFAHGDVTSTFGRRGERFVVTTEGANGAVTEHEVRWAFGVYPLQQYIIALPGGHYQPLPYAWDARPAGEGGQRWFSLDPLPRPLPDDERHWAGRYANWNHMCADCHSTGVRKGYDEATDAFRTTFVEINVGCEGCHGPSSRHVVWAEKPEWLRARMRRGAGDTPARLTERRDVRWTTDPSGRAIARNAPRTSDREIEVCAQCHARRAHLADGYTAGAPFFDFYDPAFLTAGLYHADGQQLGEVYNYASFLQSRMYAAGVTCSDCHDPHAARPRRSGNAVCAQCHAAARYDTTAHHFHPRAGAGTRCVDCHMPDTAYMGIDRRHDHSMRVPRPDLAARHGLPDACTRCHADRGAAWAAEQVRRWYGHDALGFHRFADAFAADERGAPGAADSLLRVARDESQPVVVRASAVARLADHPGAAALDGARVGAAHAHPMMRRAALEALEAVEPPRRVALALPLLADRARIVRMRAAWVLAAVGDSLATPERRRAFDRAAAEFVASQRYNGDRVSSHLTLGAFYAARGQLDSAAVESRAAIRLVPGNAQGWLNLAGVLIAQGRLREAEAVLREGTTRVPRDDELRAAHATVRASLARACAGGRC